MERRKFSIMDWVKIVGVVFALGVAWSSFSSRLDAHMQEMDSMLKITRLICQNTAKTELTAARCWE